MEQQSVGTENIRWDLSVMYSGVDDPQIDADLAKFTEMTKRFYTDHKSKLAESLGQAILDYTEIMMLLTKIMQYFFLMQSIDVTNATIKARSAEIDNIMSGLQGEHLTFFGLELVALHDETLQKFYASDKVVARHRPWIEHARVFRSHLLSEPVEAALTKRSPFGPSAWSDFFDELSSDLRFNFRGKQKTLTEMLHIIFGSKDSEERSEAMRIVNTGLDGSYAKCAAQILYVMVGLAAVENQERGYPNPMDARNKANRISDSMVNALHNAVREVAAPLAQRFYRLKAVHLDVKTLKWSDRNVPIPLADTTVIPLEEGLKIVLAAYESFSPTLANIARDLVEKKRIDAPAIKTKRGGAFNVSIVLPDGKPYSFVLLNYLGSNLDVMTIAHELGHGAHGILAGEAQGALMHYPSIPLCETASIFGEMLTFDFLKKRLVTTGNQESRLALVMGKMDAIINTVVRQIGFSNFERRLHGMDPTYQKWGRPRKFSVEELNAMWLQTLKEFYGQDGEIFTYEDVGLLWSYISHFHVPFYVYGYAFGELLTHILYAEQARLGRNFEPLFLDLLRFGNTQNVVELLEPFGLDPTGEQFWVNGIQQSLGRLIIEAEQLSTEIGIVTK